MAPDVVVAAEDRLVVGVAAVRQSAATVLRAVMLHRACMVAQGSVCGQLNRIFAYFRWWRILWDCQKEKVIFFRVEKLKDVWDELGVVIYDNGNILEWQGLRHSWDRWAGLMRSNQELAAAVVERQAHCTAQVLAQQIVRYILHLDDNYRPKVLILAFGWWNDWWVLRWRFRRAQRALRRCAMWGAIRQWCSTASEAVAMGKIGAIQMVAARAHQLADLMHMWLSRQLTGGATRHWKEAINVTAAVAAAVVAEAMERKRVAVDRAASMRRCILQLNKIVVLSLRPGPYMIVPALFRRVLLGGIFFAVLVRQVCVRVVPMIA